MTTIRISPGQLTDSLALVNGSALTYCVAFGSDAAGVFYEQRWPSLSTGEKLLWSVLAWLNGAPEHPPLDDLRAGLDDHNYVAASAALVSGGVAVR